MYGFQGLVDGTLTQRAGTEPASLIGSNQRHGEQVANIRGKFPGARFARVISGHTLHQCPAKVGKPATVFFGQADHPLTFEQNHLTFRRTQRATVFQIRRRVHRKRMRGESRLGDTIEAAAAVEIHDSLLRFAAVKPSNQSMIPGNTKGQQAIGRVSSLVESPRQTYVLHNQRGSQCSIHYGIERSPIELLKVQVPASGSLAPLVTIRKLSSL